MDWKRYLKSTYRLWAIVLALMLFATTAYPISIVAQVDSETEEELTPWGEIQAEIDEAPDDGEEYIIKLEEDIKAEAGEEALSVGTGQNIKLDLAGHTIDRGLSAKNKADDGYVIRIDTEGILNIVDTSKKPGLITGGANDGKGGGIFLEEKAELTLDNGVQVMNNAAKYGGGIYLSQESELYLGSCTIWGNDVTNNGGGIYGGDGHVTFLGGLTKVKNNTKDGNEKNENNLFMPAEMEKLRFWTWTSKNERTRKARYSDPLKKGSRIGILLEEMRKEISDGYGQCNSVEASVYFFYDKEEYIVSDDKNKSEITIVKDPDKVKQNTSMVVELYKDGKLKSTETYGQFTQAFKKAQESDFDAVLTMGSDYSSDKEIVLGKNKQVTIDLNGHYIKRERGYKYEKNGGVICVESGATLTIEDSNPKIKGYDGVKGGVITGGASSNYGGGVTVKTDGHLIMKGGTIYDCITDEDGGGVYLDTGSKNTSFKMTGGRIYNCRTLDSADDCNGGGIYLGDGKLELRGGTIDNCFSEDYGGGIYCNRGQVSLKKMVFSGNKATNRGGAIYIALDIAKYDGTLFYASDCNFVNNISNEDGGAFFMRDNPEHGGAVMFDRCSFRDNEAKEDGGAICVFDDGCVLSNVEVKDNKAGGYGGGVFVDSRYDINVKGVVVIKDNKSEKDSNCCDLALEDGTSTTARVNSGGLVKGSWIGIGSTSNKSILLSKKISVYEMKYFHPHAGNIKAKKVEGVDADMVFTSSIFGLGELSIIMLIGGIGIIMAAGIGIYTRRKTMRQEKKGDEL
ncbi:right-handed parallel beta-helix repeat-containing protein [Eubacterium xylanophilum]|uniref:right-handed parallel beta-helix repeat-containing protein n=1 Tax=Eubacterium xylanophilum TaxID=39497 RepID=UPI00047970C7|nr:right-handed parallel beta-helix repeat-containing protein [Eubacterium xylanophilum]